MTESNERRETTHGPQRTAHGLLALMTAVAVLTLGYHPYAEDGGVYIAGVKRLLDPALYPRYTEFVTEHLRFSLFAPALAALTRLLHIGLPWTLLLVYVGSIWLLLYAAWQVAARCFPAEEEQWARAGAVGLTAAWCSLPVAGTSLMMMDPYVTARSIATPLVLLAVAAALDIPRQHTHAFLKCGLWLGLVALLHPLMAAYCLGFVLLVVCAQARRIAVRRWSPAALGLAALLAAGALQLTAHPESAAQTAVAMTRFYWFPWRWEWFELIGLAAPLIIVTALVRLSLRERVAIHLGDAAVWLGVVSALAGFIFARPEMASHIVARLQPMRCFQTVYLVMTILLGGWIGQRWLRHKTALAAVVLVLAAVGPFFGQRAYYPASSHFELPGVAPRNAWVRQTGSPAATAATNAIPAGPPVMLSVVPPTSTQTVGSTFQVAVTASGARDLSSVPLSLQFDPRVLSLVNISSGDLLARDGQGVAMVRNDPSPGLITINASRPPNASGVNGQGTVMTLTFTATAAGDSSIALVKVAALSSSQSNLPAVGSQAVVHVK